jgi:hypothetical protein
MDHTKEEATRLPLTFDLTFRSVTFGLLLPMETVEQLFRWVQLGTCVRRNGKCPCCGGQQSNKAGADAIQTIASKEGMGLAVLSAFLDVRCHLCPVTQNLACPYELGRSHRIPLSWNRRQPGLRVAHRKSARFSKVSVTGDSHRFRHRRKSSLNCPPMWRNSSPLSIVALAKLGNLCRRRILKESAQQELPPSALRLKCPATGQALRPSTSCSSSSKRSQDRYLITA